MTQMFRPLLKTKRSGRGVVGCLMKLPMMNRTKEKVFLSCKKPKLLTKLWKTGLSLVNPLRHQ